MIQQFVDKFMQNEAVVRGKITQAPPSNYYELVKLVIEHIIDPTEYTRPDPSRIHQIDDGDYQGTLVFVIGAHGYQPSDYWYVRVYYGSCSGCDTLEAIRDSWSNDPLTPEQVNDYWTLALHIVQNLAAMQDA